MKKNILIIALVLAAAVYGCSKFDTSFSLKGSVENSVAKINTAASDLSVSQGYQLLSGSASPGKGETGYTDSIDLGMVAGIYDFDPSQVLYTWYPCPQRFFKKTGVSEKMVVKMPQRMVYQPRFLFNYIYKDTVRNNNFTITASDYHYYYSKYSKFDYKLLAGFTLDQEEIGSLDIVSNAADYGWLNNNYLSSFNFAEGYKIEVAMQRGDDTTAASFSLVSGDEILLREKRVYTGDRCHNDFEKTYTLTIGNVKIVRSTAVDSIQVFLRGVLQKKAAARITDDNDTEGTICHRRDIILTFDDGTTANLSEMIKPGMDVVKSLVDSLRSMYFARYVVDYIAANIYYHEFKMPHSD